MISNMNMWWNDREIIQPKRVSVAFVQQTGRNHYVYRLTHNGRSVEFNVQSHLEWHGLEQRGLFRTQQAALSATNAFVPVVLGEPENWGTEADPNWRLPVLPKKAPESVAKPSWWRRIIGRVVG